MIPQKINKRKGVLIIGTDTEIGKTTVAAGLGYMLAKNGKNVGIMKPFSSGIKEYSKVFRSQDVKILKKATNNSDSDIVINPFFYSIPTAPYLAMKILPHYKPVQVKQILEKYSSIEKKYHITIVEGIGGLMVPICKNLFFADVAKRLDLPTILVMSNKIGTLNHIILTSHVCKYYKLKIIGIIINNTIRFTQRKLKMIETILPDIVKEVTGYNILAVIPYFKNPSPIKIAQVLENAVPKNYLDKIFK